jgi:hypothetical protein
MSTEPWQNDYWQGELDCRERISSNLRPPHISYEVTLKNVQLEASLRNATVLRYNTFFVLWIRKYSLIKSGLRNTKQSRRREWIITDCISYTLSQKKPASSPSQKNWPLNYLKCSKSLYYTTQNKIFIAQCSDSLCVLVVRVPGYRSRGPGSILDATRFSER